LPVLLEGEALLNNGVVFTTFLYLIRVLQRDPQWGVVPEFFYQYGVGIVLGFIFGITAVEFSQLLYDDYISHFMLSAIGVFGTFLIAEGFARASGILALVGFGLCYSYFRHGGGRSHVNQAMVPGI
jgi:NhaP-type Na+/H+ or K+/H+ antiporter